MDDDESGSIDLYQWLNSVSQCSGLAAAIAANVDEEGTLPNYRTFEQQKEKRQQQIQKLQGLTTRSQEEERILLDYTRQVEKLTQSISQAKINEGAGLSSTLGVVHDLIEKFEERYNSLHEAFLKTDDDKSGMVTSAEIRAFCLDHNLEDKSEQILGYFDHDHDDKLDYNEFLHLLSFETFEKHHNDHSALVVDLVAKKDERSPEEEAQLEQYQGHVKQIQTKLESLKAYQQEAFKNTQTLVKQLNEKLEQRFDSLREAFLKVDEDRSGKITAAEIKHLCEIYNLHEQSEQVIAAFDVDHNGQLDYNEFAKVLKGHF